MTDGPRSSIVSMPASLRRGSGATSESDARFRRLAESGIVGIAVADVMGQVVEANDTCLELFGYSREELLSGQIRWEDLTPDDLMDVNARATETLILTGAAKPWESAIMRRNGERVPVLVGAAAVEPPNLIVFFVDLSERMHAEEALRESEAQLRQAQKMDAVGRLAGGVAHDFNNLLSVIMSYSELVLSDMTAQDPLRADIIEIQRAAGRAAELTRQLLAFSRQQVLSPRDLDLEDLLRDMERMLRRVVGEHIEIARLSVGDLDRVHADAGSVEQVVMNLVVNARDAMPSGGRLMIETRNVVLDEEFARTHHGVVPGRYVALSVADTGVGMDAATRARVFEPFFTTKPKERGTGLGLATVFGIVEQSGGTIWVESTVGQGTTFRIYLPAIQGDAPRSAPVAREAPERGTETLLLVEDEDAVRQVACGILRRAGYEVIEARGPADAIRLAEEYPTRIHLLVSDVVMPKMSGIELSRVILERRSDIRVLFISGYTPDSVERDGLDAGVNFLQKPFTPRVLARRVREVLDAK